jgi:hypothetical protein
MELTGNNVGFFNNYTLLDTVRRRHLEGAGDDLFSKQGRVMQIPFFVNDDEKLFVEAFCFNFSPKGVQLGDFHPDGRTTLTRLDDIETAVKYLRSFWELVYETEDVEGPLRVGAVWEPLLLKLETSMLLRIVSPEYVGAVINRKLGSLAAELDAALPVGQFRSPREWWKHIGVTLANVSFSRENEELYLWANKKAGRQTSHQSEDRGTTRGLGPPAIVTPSKPAGGLPTAAETEQLCYIALKHHYQLPVGSAACGRPDCVRIHPGAYKKWTIEQMVNAVQGSRLENAGEVISAVRADSKAFRA